MFAEVSVRSGVAIAIIPLRRLINSSTTLPLSPITLAGISTLSAVNLKSCSIAPYFLLKSSANRLTIGVKRSASSVVTMIASALSAIAFVALPPLITAISTAPAFSIALNNSARTFMALARPV